MRQKLILLQIHGHTLDAWPVLHGRRGLGLERGAVDAVSPPVESG